MLQHWRINYHCLSTKISNNKLNFIVESTKYKKCEMHMKTFRKTKSEESSIYGHKIHFIVIRPFSQSKCGRFMFHAIVGMGLGGTVSLWLLLFLQGGQWVFFLCLERERKKKVQLPTFSKNINAAQQMDQK